MSLLPFLALNMVVALLSKEGKKALRFHQKYLNLCTKNEPMKVLRVWNDMKVKN